MVLDLLIIKNMDMFLKSVPVILSVMVFAGCQTTQMDSAPKVQFPHEWANGIDGKYDGFLINNNQTTSAITTIAAYGGAISGVYEFKEAGRVEKGLITGCAPDNYGVVVCSWQDKYGAGKVEMNFTRELDEFWGSWGSGQKIDPSKIWNGKKL